MVNLESANQQIGSGTTMHEGTLMLIFFTEFHHGLPYAAHSLMIAASVGRSR
jgi:hypothetical protein